MRGFTAAIIKIYHEFAKLHYTLRLLLRPSGGERSQILSNKHFREVKSNNVDVDPRFKSQENIVFLKAFIFFVDPHPSVCCCFWYFLYVEVSKFAKINNSQLVQRTCAAGRWFKQPALKSIRGWKMKRNSSLHTLFIPLSNAKIVVQIFLFGF